MERKSLIYIWTIVPDFPIFSTMVHGKRGQAWRRISLLKNLKKWTRIAWVYWSQTIIDNREFVYEVLGFTSYECALYQQCSKLNSSEKQRIVIQMIISKLDKQSTHEENGLIFGSWSAPQNMKLTFKRNSPKISKTN